MFSYTQEIALKNLVGGFSKGSSQFLSLTSSDVSSYVDNVENTDNGDC